MILILLYKILPCTAGIKQEKTLIHKEWQASLRIAEKIIEIRFKSEVIILLKLEEIKDFRSM